MSLPRRLNNPKKDTQHNTSNCQQQKQLAHSLTAFDGWILVLHSVGTAVNESFALNWYSLNK